jgi:DNA/RNA-binding domain of Phe-tRNA-synthetase-like protein
LKIEEELQSTFPGLSVVEFCVFDLKIKKIDPRLELFKQEVQQKIRANVGSLEGIKDNRIVRAYRDFYWKVGIDPTKTRPAGEALARRIIGGKILPTINTFVDSYNLASAQTFIAIGAFDLNKVHEASLLMRRASKGERFLGIGMEREIELSGAEIVIEDRVANDLIAVYPYRDSDASKVTEDSKDVLLMMCGVPGITEEELEKTRSLSSSYVESFCIFS